MSKTVEVENLTKRFKLANGGSVKALDCVNMHVMKGEIAGIIGESGSGKTTLLRTIRGVEAFDEGIVRVEDVTLTPKSTADDFHKVKTKTAIHIQRSFSLWPESVANNVIRALYYSEYGEENLPSEDSSQFGEYRKQALEMLKVVGLDHRAELWAEVLSGGEKQRLILARQLARKPAIILLDEPATMTCPKTRDDVIKAIKSANEEMNTTFLMVSHMPELHRKISQRLLLLKNGCVSDEGDVEKVLEKFLAGIAPQEEKRRLSKKKSNIMRLKKVTKTYRLVPYGEVFTIKNFNLDIHKNEILGIIGPSGAGKTVLLRLLAGLELPTEGSVLLEAGRRWADIGRLGKESMKARQKIGILHQEYSLPYWSKVADVLAHRMALKSWEIAQEALKRASRLGINEKAVDIIHRVAELPEEEAKQRLESMGLSTDIIQELFRAFPMTVVKKRVVRVFESLKLPVETLYRRAYELSAGEQIRVAMAALLISKPSILLLDEPFGDLDPITLRLSLIHI